MSLALRSMPSLDHQVPIYIDVRSDGIAQLTPLYLVPFSSPSKSGRITVQVSNPLHKIVVLRITWR
jgi:hypothetical protein